MKLKRARIGEKFVFTDEPGVWEKMSDGKAKLVFGNRNDIGNVVDTNLESFVYVIFEGKGQKPREEKRAAPVVPDVVEIGSKGSVTVIMEDSDEKVINKITGLSYEKAMMISTMDYLVLKKKAYSVMDRAFKLESEEVRIEVSEMGVVEK